MDANFFGTKETKMEISEFGSLDRFFSEWRQFFGSGQICLTCNYKFVNTGLFLSHL